MIATLSGNILSKGLDRAIVDVGGVGYEVFLSTDSIARLPDVGEAAFLFIHTHVREDALVLYGFSEEEQKEMFLILVSVSGIGPKLGLAILSGMQVPALCQAISSKDIKSLTGLQGVGKKTAERICVELKDKVGHLHTAIAVADGVGEPAVVAGAVVSDVLSALGNLGYPDPVARQAMTEVKRRVGEEEFATLQFDELIRESLRSLA